MQISCCEFEYFSINKRYTSRRRQRNERTKSQNEPARIWGAVIHGNIDIHNRVRTPEKCSPRIYLPFSKAIYWGNCTWFNLPRLTVPFVWFCEFELDYGYLVTPYLSQKISGREIVGVWKLARLVTADWNTRDFQRWPAM